MTLNLSNEMLHALIRATQTREDLLANIDRGNTEEASLLTQFQDMAYDILHREVENHTFSWSESGEILHGEPR